MKLIKKLSIAMAMPLAIIPTASIAGCSNSKKITITEGNKSVLAQREKYVIVEFAGFKINNSSPKTLLLVDCSSHNVTPRIFENADQTFSFMVLLNNINQQETEVKFNIKIKDGVNNVEFELKDFKITIH